MFNKKAWQYGYNGGAAPGGGGGGSSSSSSSASASASANPFGGGAAVPAVRHQFASLKFGDEAPIRLPTRQMLAKFSALETALNTQVGRENADAEPVINMDGFDINKEVFMLAFNKVVERPFLTQAEMFDM